jgi:3-oxoacyl-[acyl-carrier protein] reductase
MDFGLSDRVAIITGCSVGIGREVAKVLASEGVQTVVIARRGGLLATLQDEIVAAGGPRPQAMAVDVLPVMTDRPASTHIEDENPCITHAAS